MNESWQAKLRRLGVTKGARHLREQRYRDPPRADEESEVDPRSNLVASSTDLYDNQDDGEPIALHQLLPSLDTESNDLGAYKVLDRVFSLQHQHGNEQLNSLLDHPPASATFHHDARLKTLSFRDFVFLDTETTGLAGANVMAFLVGIGYFDEDAFIVRQFFVPDFDAEGAMLLALSQAVRQKRGLITFNGRSFDIPLLDGRYLMNRLDDAANLTETPHLDLLHPARRVWRARLGSCALGSLERSVLAVHRNEADVPGWLIPRIYHNFLRDGDGRELARVFYHNEVDILSMATLAARLLRHFKSPLATDPPLDLWSLGRWRSQLGEPEAAEQAFRLALDGDLSLPDYRRAMSDLALLLKRRGRREEAVPLWQQLAFTSYDDVDAHVELAKHYEWQVQDLEQALRWIKQALQLAESWSHSQARLVLPQLHHRMKRVQRKLERS